MTHGQYLKNVIERLLPTNSGVVLQIKDLNKDLEKQYLACKDEWDSLIWSSGKGETKAKEGELLHKARILLLLLVDDFRLGLIEIFKASSNKKINVTQMQTIEAYLYRWLIDGSHFIQTNYPLISKKNVLNEANLIGYIEGKGAVTKVNQIEEARPTPSKLILSIDLSQNIEILQKAFNKLVQHEKKIYNSRIEVDRSKLFRPGKDDLDYIYHYIKGKTFAEISQIVHGSKDKDISTNIGKRIKSIEHFQFSTLSESTKKKILSKRELPENVDLYLDFSIDELYSSLPQKVKKAKKK